MTLFLFHSFNHKLKWSKAVLDGELTSVNSSDPLLPDSQPPARFFEYLWIGKDAQSFGEASSIVGEQRKPDSLSFPNWIKYAFFFKAK